ncbi:lipopolysaccharide biosynthesis protein [Pedobacter sp. HMF7647]|uniref:Lipopolysaccharide biosynthesis protein n=1 Tax=Hufsiella arboris TaxID=2695275 RepID=A0A7K1YFH5_9SPHI|nr:glycoside hydrolase family 99-like domain-containing protein [Hufsiella arboris]MXV52828.1 lipopolysaccharide biosynthesis protein [Hufsiella arboris]
MFRALAYYLPQYHPIPENDNWWGKGFTEWTNVTKAKPLFQDHYQPRFPTELGYYDLRVQEVQRQQAELAADYGIEGFIYYHYWFGNGKTLLERPLQNILNSNEPDFPFCLCWANETWKGIWFGNTNPGVLIEQTYPGKDDYVSHFDYLLSAFQDPRYICIEGKPVFNVYMPGSIPDLKLFTDTIRDCAHKAGLPGIYLLASRCPADWNPDKNGFDGVIGSEFSTMRYYTAKYYESANPVEKVYKKIKNKVFGHPEINLEVRKKPIIVEYEKAINYLLPKEKFDYDYFPCVIPNWDNTARSGTKGLVFHNSTPDLWKRHLRQAADYVKANNEDKRILIIKSWNEWAEGNYLEPDAKFGRQYLEKLKEVVG